MSVIKSPAKVVITGAAGQIGYAATFRIASGAMLGDRDIELRLLELEPALPALHGIAMELEDCAFPLLKKVVCTSSLQEAMDGANYVVSIGAVPRKEGMERADLLRINGGIFGPQGKAINDYAADDIQVLVVGNPCNTNCLIAMHSAPDVPNDRFFAMTSLDELRSKTQLAKKAGVDVSAITNMTVWGNHSALQFPDFYHAKIHGKPVPDVINDHAWLEQTFIPMIQQRGATVIKARGASSAASAANAAITAVRHLVMDTPTGDSYSMARCSHGEYGIDEGLIFSFPSRTDNGVSRIVTGLTHNAFAQEKIRLVLEELRAEYRAVQELGLI